MQRFDAPGFLSDLSDAGRDAWSDWISRQLDLARARDGREDGLTNFGPRPRFFNARTTAPAADAVERDITWTAFPRLVRIQSVSDRQRWRRADSSRDVQDEYCEWSVSRDPQTDRIVRVTFTSEGPEYWTFLAATSPQTLLDLYRQHVSPDVRMEHLLRDGEYDPRNRWNNSTTNGAMHLIQANNTLGAEIELAAAATVVRMVGGRTLQGEQELIECGRYGQAERNSDPRIGAAVNEIVRELAADVTLANPVGLYLADLSVAGWETPDGSDPRELWTVTRGTPAKALRAVFEVPTGRGFTVSDVTISGKPIEFGAQIADAITVKLTGVATRLGSAAPVPASACVQRSGLAAIARPAQLSVADALAPRPRRMSR